MFGKGAPDTMRLCKVSYQCFLLPETRVKTSYHVGNGVLTPNRWMGFSATAFAHHPHCRWTTSWRKYRCISSMWLGPLSEPSDQHGDISTLSSAICMQLIQNQKFQAHTVLDDPDVTSSFWYDEFQHHVVGQQDVRDSQQAAISRYCLPAPCIVQP